MPVPASELRDMNRRAIVGSDVVVGYMAAEHMETVRELLNRDPSNGSGKMRFASGPQRAVHVGGHPGACVLDRAELVSRSGLTRRGSGTWCRLTRSGLWPRA